jgi:hypothetical protein
VRVARSEGAEGVKDGDAEKAKRPEPAWSPAADGFQCLMALAKSVWPQASAALSRCHQTKRYGRFASALSILPASCTRGALDDRRLLRCAMLLF